MKTGLSYAAASMIQAAESNQKSIYNDLKRKSMDSLLYGTDSQPMKMVGESGIIYRIYKSLCGYMPYVMVLSIVFGILVFILARKNKGLRRFGFYGLCIGIPLCVLIFIFGFGAMCGMFLQE